MLLYGISRFVIEFFRGDERGMVFGGISTSQFISLLLVPLSRRRCCCSCRGETELPTGVRGAKPSGARPDADRWPPSTVDSRRPTRRANGWTGFSRRSCPGTRARRSSA